MARGDGPGVTTALGGPEPLPAATLTPGDVEGTGEPVVTDGASTGRVADSDVLDGPFSPRQLFRLDEALRVADRETGLTFSVFVGDLEEPVREHAERLLSQLARPAESVLLAVSPNQRRLEIVTGEASRRRLPDRICALAALSMTAAFGGGDLTGGVLTGLRMLADQAGRP